MRESNTFEPKIGEFFKFNGVVLKCVESDSQCTGCYFRQYEHPYCPLLCDKTKRIDKREVIFLKQKPSYEELQAKWVEENNIKVGSKVRILNTDQIGEVESIDEFRIEVIFRGKDESGIGHYSYESLEPVKEEEFKVGDIILYTTLIGEKKPAIIKLIKEDNYHALLDFLDCSFCGELSRAKPLTKDDFVPYDLSKKKVRDKLRGRWAIYKQGDDFTIEGMIESFRFNTANWYLRLDNSLITSEELLRKWTFLNGLPCGELKEASND